MKERITVSLEPEALAIAHAEVKAGRASSVSAAVEQALQKQGRKQALRKSLELWEAEYGPISEEAREWGRRELDRASREISSSTRER